ncbi:MAG: AAA family ATPase [Candidatus Aquicultorales bacterium]
MIPIELKLTNFMSYGMMEEPLSFTSFRMASLCGLNGHGKSTLLDAITWALWGQARGVDGKGSGTDDLIKAGETFMAVEFVFELEGNRYRVARAREKKNKAGASQLNFSILDGETAHSLNGETISLTQEKIDRTLRMDFDTFVNSAFVLQGRADSFMAKNPNERKEVLSEILGLSLYGELEDRARDKRRSIERELTALDAGLIAIEGELARRPEYQDALDASTARASEAKNALGELEETLAELRERKAKREAVSAQVADLRRRALALRSEVDAGKERLKGLDEEETELKKLTDNEAVIQDGARLLREARAEDERLSEAAARRSAIEAALHKAKSEVAAAEASLRTKIDHFTREKAQLEQVGAQTERLLVEVNDCTAALDTLAPLEARRSAARERYSEIIDRKGELTGERLALGSRSKEIEEHLATIHGADACPLCRKTLEGAERESLERDLGVEKSRIEQSMARVDEEKTRLEAELAEVEAGGKHLSKRLEQASELQEKLGRLQAELKTSMEARERSRQLETEIADAVRALESSEFAREAREQAVGLEAEINEIGYDPAVHKEVKGAIKEREHFEAEEARLETSMARAAALKVEKARLEADIAEKERALLLDARQIGELEGSLGDEDPINELKRLEAKTLELTQAEKIALEEAAVAREGLARCDKFEAEKRGNLKQRERLSADMQTFSDLTVAFSKKGIPALIIENAIPEIEDEANALLRSLTGGRMSIRFITQKGQRSGGIVETLDLMISDGETGDRKYELFSGGEAFRINFAIRIALSKLLTRRAGARLEMLIVDEGFGTQDEEGRDRLIEALGSVAKDFEKIIVITHLDELKEVFPARIEVVKKPGIGSVATVV